MHERVETILLVPSVDEVTMNEDADRERGFAVASEILTREETARLIAALAAAGSRSRAGARHLMSQPAVAAIAGDPRLLRLARSWVGPEAMAYRATLFDKSTRSNWLVAWHQDTALPLRERRDVTGCGLWSTKAGVLYAHAPAAPLEAIVALRIHLDDSIAENGPLRVIPGSHRAGVLSDDEMRGLAGSVRAHRCTVERGGVLAMRPLLVHASSKSITDTPRRVLHVEYTASRILEGGLEIATA